jgi:hypothetical protein
MPLRPTWRLGMVRSCSPRQVLSLAADRIDVLVLNAGIHLREVLSESRACGRT